MPPTCGDGVRATSTPAPSSVAVPEAPVGVPDVFSEHMMLMFDLLAVAWQADSTRVFSYMLNRDEVVEEDAC